MTPAGAGGSRPLYRRGDRNPLYAAADPPAFGRCPTARGPSVAPATERRCSAKSGGHHRKENQRADRELDKPEPAEARHEQGHLRCRGGVTARGERTEFQESERPSGDGRACQRVDPDREDDAGEDGPRPPRVEPGELPRASGHKEIEHARQDRELRDAKDVPELPWDDIRHDRAARGRRAGEECRELYQDRVEAAADP
jgi:hypothetical protein